jgi:hypothetical protein
MIAPIFNKYNNSPYKLLTSVYPEHDWMPWIFARCPREYWADKKNHRKFLEYLAKELNIKDKNDWYKVGQKVVKHSFNTYYKEINKYGGLSLLVKEYGGSPSKLITSCYPEYNWDMWKFDTCAHRFWEDLKNQRKFLEDVAKELNFNEMSDWYKMTQRVSFFLSN